MTLSQADMRILVKEGFRRQVSREPTRPEAQLVQAVAILETGCGSGWHRPKDWPADQPFDPWNMGAVQKGGWTGRVFSYVDTHPNSDGSNTPYRVDFRYYASAQEGTEDLVRVVYRILGRDKAVLVPASNGDALGFSTGLHATHYYEGFGATVADRIKHHHEAVLHACAVQALALGEPMPDGSVVELPENPIPMTLRVGAHSATVGLLQRALDLDDDGIFGPHTLAAVLDWQIHHALKPDGIVGPATWKSLGVS